MAHTRGLGGGRLSGGRPGAGMIPFTAVVSLLLVGAAVYPYDRADAPTSQPSSKPKPTTRPVARSTAVDALRGIEGMMISCPGSGREWGRQGMVDSMVELKAMGLNWVAIHPYAGIRADGSVPEWFDLSTPPEWLTRPIAEAKRLGMKIMIKPHLGYWGTKFSWRGEITFDTAEQWERFFTQYRRWILRVAELSKGADLFVVATELDKTLAHEKEWRSIIRDVRARYSGPLTFSPNWSDYQRVPFWDALDVIGVHAYFPLVEHGEQPTRTRIEAGWRRVVGELRAFSDKHRKPIVFTELGYNRSAITAHRPWDAKTGGDGANTIQCDCLDVAMRTIAGEEKILGAFLWKWFSEKGPPRDFSMHDDHVRAVIKARWGQ